MDLLNLQTSKKLLPAIRLEGCYFLSIISEFFDNENKINSFYHKMVQNKIILPNCYVLNPYKLLAQFKQVKEFIRSDMLHLDAILTIGKVRDRSHFVRINDQKTVIDPLASKLIEYKPENFSSYRIFK